MIYKPKNNSKLDNVITMRVESDKDRHMSKKNKIQVRNENSRIKNLEMKILILRSRLDKLKKSLGRWKLV